MKLAAISMIKTVCGEDVANKLEFILILDNTIERRLDRMFEKIFKLIKNYFSKKIFNSNRIIC